MKTWKNWPYWVIGGLIGVIYSLVVFSIVANPEGEAEAFGLFYLNFPAFYILTPIFKFLIDPTGGAINGSPLFVTKNIIIFYGMITVANFVICAFLGWLYGKIKNRKNNSPSPTL